MAIEVKVTQEASMRMLNSWHFDISFCTIVKYQLTYYCNKSTATEKAAKVIDTSTKRPIFP